MFKFPVRNFLIDIKKFYDGIVVRKTGRYFFGVPFFVQPRETGHAY